MNRFQKSIKHLSVFCFFGLISISIHGKSNDKINFRNISSKPFLTSETKNDIDKVSVSSPDHHIVFTLQNQNGKLTYQINYNKAQVIENSNLGLNVNGSQVGLNSKILKVEKYSANETYTTRGVHNTAKNQYKAAKINFSSVACSFAIEVKAFNDGVAFRYVVNKEGISSIDKDFTTFTIPTGSTIWSQPNFTHYEGKYGVKKAEEFKLDDRLGPPASILLPDLKTYLAITEGGLTDFAGMSLIANGNRSFQSFLTGNTKKTGVIETSWRIIEIGKDLNALVNCDIISHVSPKYDEKLFPKGFDTDWIKPGRSVWSWLSGENRAVTLENMKKFSDQAAELGFEYNLVDEGWGNWKDGNRDHWELMKELVDYSAKKGVKIWAWKAYPNRKGIEGLKDEEKRIAFFKKCKEVGVVGVKIDFFDSESQDIIQFYQAALKNAAESQLMVNFHGANKPTGETRTWPNEMSREAIKGLESRPPWAKHHTILPFTRFLAGHADYTPIHFGDRMGEVTWAHHIASLAIFNSSFLCLGASPQSVINHPFKEMITSIPPVWDETIVLPQSKIGELVLFARRKGNQWFLAGLNGIHEPQTIAVDLSFLGKGQYQLSAIKDDTAKQASGEKFSKKVNAKTTININLNPEGGFMGKLDKLDK